MYAALGGAVAALLLAIAAYFHGVGVGIDKQRSADLEQMLKDEKVARKQIEQGQKLDEAAAGRSVERQTITRELTREIPKIIDRPVYGNFCIDAGGVRLIGRAVAAANGEQPPGGGRDGEAGQVREAPDNAEPDNR